MTLPVKAMPVATFLVVMATYCTMNVSCCVCVVISSVEDSDVNFSLLVENETADDEAVILKQSTISTCGHFYSIVMYGLDACPLAHHHHVVHRAEPLIVLIPSCDQASVNVLCHGGSRLHRPTYYPFCCVLLVAHLRAFLSCVYHPQASGDEEAYYRHPPVSRALIGELYWGCPCQKYRIEVRVECKRCFEWKTVMSYFGHVIEGWEQFRASFFLVLSGFNHSVRV